MSDIFQANDGRFAIEVRNKAAIDVGKPNESRESIGLVVRNDDLRLELDLDYSTVEAFIARLREELETGN